MGGSYCIGGEPRSGGGEYGAVSSSEHGGGQIQSPLGFDKSEFKLASLEEISRGSWSFKVSANNYESGILIIASNYQFDYTTCKYFSNHIEAREWLNNMVIIGANLESERL